MSVKNRLKEFAEYQKMTISSFEKSIDVSNGYVNSISKSIGLDKIDKIVEKYSNISLDWLLTGKGSMLRDENVKDFSLHTDNKHENQHVPLYDLTATASVLEIFSETKASVPLDHISIPNLPKCDGAIHITGDSMYPLLKSGDIVMYREVQNMTNIIWGEMYLIYLNDDGDEFFFVKYIHKSDKKGYIRLVSANQHHEPKDFKLSSIKQLAIVKASIRVNSIV